MFTLDEPIVAISSAPVRGPAAGSIVRLSGPGVFSIASRVLSASLDNGHRGIVSMNCSLEGVQIQMQIYCFPYPHSYTGQEMVEIHLTAAEPVIERLLSRFMTHVRAAEPGEFTWRAYANGRMDLTQAEAVAQIVSGSNAVQLRAAEKLLEGNLSGRIGVIREQILDLLSLLEAGMDFAQEQIELISVDQAIGRIVEISNDLQGLLGGAIQYERMIDLPAVGLAGSVNAGKSSLLNALLGRDRSIVSDRQATTRDVLAEVCSLESVDCVLFDCAGLSKPGISYGTLDVMAQQAARTSLGQADCVVYCVDAMVDDQADQKAIIEELEPIELLGVLTKCDQMDVERVQGKKLRIQEELGFDFHCTSAVTGQGIEELKQILSNELSGPDRAGSETDVRIAVNQRHRQILSQTVKNLSDCADEIKGNREEIAAMVLREAYQRLGGLEREDIQEAVLERIFSRFCIGK